MTVCLESIIILGQKVWSNIELPSLNKTQVNVPQFGPTKNVACYWFCVFFFFFFGNKSKKDPSMMNIDSAT